MHGLLTQTVGVAVSVSSPGTIADEQFAARELVRSWAAGSGAVAAARDVEHGQPDAWRAPYQGLAQLGTFGVALPEEHGGAVGTAGDLCAQWSTKPPRRW